jgi:hypothetical protein
MNKLLVLVPALLAGCDGLDHRRLTDLGAVTAEVNVDLGAPWGTSSSDVHPGMQVSLEYTEPGCLSLEDDAEGSLDGRHAEYSEIGGISEGEVHGHFESYCVQPAFYFERLPEARDVSTIVVADGSAHFSIEVPRLLVNPTITLGELQRGSTAVARVEDPRPIASTRVWYSDDANQFYWPVDPTIVGNEVHFPVPSTARGTGTLGIVVTFDDHELTCAGFASCEVSVQGGASFVRTIQ